MADDPGADPGLFEPLINEEGMMEFPVFDERLLKELQSLNAAEAGFAGGESPPEYVDDNDVYKMKELIKEKPKDVIQYLEEEGVAKLGEFEIQDTVAFRAFNKDSILTVNWEAMWRDQLAEYGRSTEGIGWTTKVMMEAHVVNLRDAAAEGSRGLLHPLLKRYHAHACSAAVFALPAVQAVIHFKWTTWARRFLLYELCCYCLWLVSYTAFTLLFQQENWTMTFQELLNGFLATVCSLLALMPMSTFLYMDLCTIAAYGMGWVGAWNLLDMASYFLQIVICVLHLQRDYVDEGWFSVLVASQHVLMWTKLHYFAKVFNPTKNTIIDTIRIVVEDIKWFLLFLTLTMIGFGLAFYSLFRQDRDRFMDFTNIWHSFASMFSYMLAMFDYNVFYNSTNPTAAMLLFIMFEFVMNVLLFNVLIASMTNSFSKITQDEGLRFLCSKAEIIDELESTLPAWIKSPRWYPKFIHILKFHPDSTYEVNLNSVWSGMGLMENNLLGAQQETRLRVEELEDRLSKLHKKLDVLIKLFISSMHPGHAIGLSRQATGTVPYYNIPVPPAAEAPGGPFARPTGGTSAAQGGASMSGQEDAAVGGSGGRGEAHYWGRSTSVQAKPHTPVKQSISQLPERLAAVSGPFLGPVHPGLWPGVAGLGWPYGMGVLPGRPEPDLGRASHPVRASRSTLPRINTTGCAATPGYQQLQPLPHLGTAFAGYPPWGYHLAPASSSIASYMMAQQHAAAMAGAGAGAARNLGLGRGEAVHGLPSLRFGLPGDPTVGRVGSDHRRPCSTPMMLSRSQSF
eukprot:gene3763-4022_t